MSSVHLFAFGFDRSLAVLCLVGGIAAIFIGYLIFDGIQHWWRHRRHHGRRSTTKTQGGRGSEG